MTDKVLEKLVYKQWIEISKVENHQETYKINFDFFALIFH